MPMLYGPLLECPSCKQPKSYGRCFIGDSGLMFRCQRCAHCHLEPLPTAKKKIIYIDQFALSKMVKLKGDTFWSHLYRRLIDLASEDLIACPYAFIHAEESLLSIALRSALKGVYRQIGGHDEFKRPGEIEKAQLTRLLKQFVGKPDPEPEPSWTDWAKKNPHCWSDLFHVHVDFDIDEDAVRSLREDKERFRKIMEGQCEEWKKKPQSFEEDVESNYVSWRTTLLKTRWHLVDWLVRWVLVLNGYECHPVFDKTLPAETWKKALGVVNEFFLSETWKQALFIWLWVRVWAKIAEMARNPKGGRKPQPGDYYDCQVLAYYSPYCDAMFIDGGFRAIACAPQLNVEARFGTRCFSEKNRDEFIAYFDDIERMMPQDHKDALLFVHPTEDE